MLHFLIAGTPSGPLAEDGRSSLMASIISSGVMSTSCIVCVAFGFRNCGSCVGLLQRLSRIDQLTILPSPWDLCTAVVIFLVALFNRGPMFVFTFLFWLA